MITFQYAAHSALIFFNLIADMKYVIEMHFWHTFGLSTDQNTFMPISYTENNTLTYLKETSTGLAKGRLGISAYLFELGMIIT